MNQIEFPSGKCSISDQWTYNQMRVVWLENDFLRIGILVGRGSDIFEFSYKPRSINFMLRLEKDIHNPMQIVSQIRDTHNQLEDYYYGGWQEILPNSVPGPYRDAQLGQHGEVWMIPWKHAIIKDTPDEVVLKCWTRPLRVPILIEKTLSLKAGSKQLEIEEKLSNESNTDLDIMWGHHIAFGLPFLEKGGIINTSATKIIAEKNMPEPRYYKPEIESPWPLIPGKNHMEVNASKIPPVTEVPYSELAYLSEFKQKAYYSIFNGSGDLGFSVHWDATVFKYLWYWQERFATQNAPWWGSTYAIALEPWTTKYSSDPQASIDRGEYLKLKSKSSIVTALKACVIDKKLNK